jgi:hypothetical protein
LAGFGGNTSYQGYTITYTPPTANTSASISFKKGEDVIVIDVISVNVDAVDDSNLPTIEKNGIIYIKQGNAEIPLADYPITKENRILIAKIIAKYAAQVGVTGRVGLGYSKIGLPDRNPAFESGGIVFINDRGGKIAQILSNKSVLLNILYHEKLHVDRGAPQSFYDHALIYYDQITHSTFKDMPEEIKNATISGFAQRALNHMVRESGTSNIESQKVLQKIAEFNSLNTGYTLTPNFSFPNEESYTITLKKGNTTYEAIRFNPNLDSVNE